MNNETLKISEPNGTKPPVSGSISFKEQMINEIIPFIERMIEKEEEHIYWLERKNAPKEFIERSKWHLNHFRQRHKEYIEYAEQGAVNRSYFHEITQEEVDKLITDKRSIGYVMENYKQPDWCNYPEALSMTMGCWSLCDLKKEGLRTKISKEFCKGCDCFGNCA